LPFTQGDIALSGHAFEARLYAEDPAHDFLPATGTLSQLRFSDCARIETGVRSGDVISPHYDPMISKIVTHGADRETALRRLAQALEDTKVAGVVTNRDFLICLARDGEFAAGQVDTGLIARKADDLVALPELEALDWAAAALAVLRRPSGSGVFGKLDNFRHFGAARQIVWFEDNVDVSVETAATKVRCATPSGSLTIESVTWDGDDLSFVASGMRQQFYTLVTHDVVTIERNGVSHRLPRRQPGLSAVADSADVILAPLTGRVVSVVASVGDKMAKGDAILVLEAMKMEHRLVAPRDGTIAALNAAVDAQVEQGAALVRLVEEEA